MAYFLIEIPKQEEEYDPQTLYKSKKWKRKKHFKRRLDLIDPAHLLWQYSLAHRLDEDKIEFLAMLKNQERKNEKESPKKKNFLKNSDG